MPAPKRPLTTLLASALLVFGAVQVASAAAPGDAPLQASAKPPASVKVLRCKSNAFYAGREITFRTRMTRTSGEDAQNLEVKVELWRKLDEAATYRRITLPGLSKPSTAKDSSVTTYQREVTIKNPETAANYKLRAVFRWRDPQSGAVKHRRVVSSKPCRQRVGLPSLSITQARSTQVAGSNRVGHTVTITNVGSSEAIGVPVTVFTDGAESATAVVSSIGPGQSADVTIDAPGCKTSAYAQIDPLRTLKRLPDAARTQFPMTKCG